MKSAVTDIRGQAVFVDLGARGNLVVTLSAPDGPKSEGLSHLSQRVYWQRNPDMKIGDMPSMTGATEISPDLLPALVYFKGINDPASYVIVDPENMAAAYGVGVEIRSVSIEVTRDPVTTGIEDKLPFLKSRDRGERLPNLGITGYWRLEPLHFYRHTYKDIRS